MKQAIHQMLPAVRGGDAVGNTALRIRDTLRELGYDSEIFRERCSPDLRATTLPAERYLEHSAPDTILLFHYSIGSELGRFVYHLPDRVVLIYHNISPPEPFIGIHDHVVGELFHGRKQLAQFAGHCVCALGASEYNRAELEQMGFPRTGVLPLAIDFSALDGEADPFIQTAYDDYRRNFLFVGRIVPNKGIEDLIKLYAHFKKWVDHNSRLIIVGDWSGFERYRSQLLRLIADIDLPDVVMPGRVDQAQLNAFYRLADVYVSLSRHEGFCVPLLEAMHCGVPVMALAAAAVPETMDGAGVLVNEMNHAEMAEMLDLLSSDGPIRARMIHGQDERLRRYNARSFSDRMREVVRMAQETAR